MYGGPCSSVSVFSASVSVASTAASFSNYDFFWQNYYENHADAETAYARFNENGSEIQAMFDASATCEGPNASDSYLFYPDPDDQV